MLLDTSGLLCLLHRDEPQHREAVRLYQEAPRKLTHNYVVAEFVVLAQARRLPRGLSLAFVGDLLDNPTIEVEWVDDALHRQGLSLLRARPRRTYSLCDAVSFLLMRREGVYEALTTDGHFEQEGFVRTLLP